MSLPLLALPAFAIPLSLSAVQDGPTTDNQEVLTLVSEGFDAIFVDSRDAGLHRALDMAGTRLAELAAEEGAPPEAQEAVATLVDLLGEPMALRVRLNEASPIGVGAQLDFWQGNAEDAVALSDHMYGLFEALGAPVQASTTDDAGFQIQLPLPMPLMVAPAMAGGRNSLRLSLGPVDDGAPVMSAAGLPEGVDVSVGFSANLGAILSMIETFEPEAAEVREVLGMFGITEPDTLGIHMVGGSDGEFGHFSERVFGAAGMLQGSGDREVRPFVADDLAMIPADATYASMGAMDPMMVVSIIESIDQAEGGSMSNEFAAVKDIVALFGTHYGMYTSMTSGGGGFASAVAFVEVEDEPALTEKIGELEGWLTEMARSEIDGRFAMRTKRIAGGPATVMMFPGLPIPVEPAYALRGGYFYMAATPHALEAALAQASGSMGDIRTNERFGQVISSSNLEAFHGMQFSDSPDLLRDGYGMATLGASALANAVRSPQDPERDPGAVLPPYNELIRGAKASGSVVHIVDNDLVVVGRSDRSMVANATAAVGSPFLMLGLLSGMAPSLAMLGLQETGSAMAIAPRVSPPDETYMAESDLFILRDAIEMYAISNDGAYPENLDELLEPDDEGFTYLSWDELIDPWGNPYIWEAPTEEQPTPRLYTLGRDDQPGGVGPDADIHGWE